MLKILIEGFREANEPLEVKEIEDITEFELKEDYFNKVDELILEKDTYQVGKEIDKIVSTKNLSTPLVFIYSKAEGIECGILFSKTQKLKVLGVWPDKFYFAINKDPDIFKSLLYRLVKTPDFFKEVKLFTYLKPVEIVKEEPRKEIAPELEKPRIPKPPSEPPAPSEEEEYITPELPFKKKITTKVSIDLGIEKPTPLEEITPKKEEEPIESYGESLISEIEEIASSFQFKGAEDAGEEVEFWDSCPFCFTRLSENTIKLLKAGLSTFCPNSKCRKLIKAEFMVKKSKK